MPSVHSTPLPSSGASAEGPGYVTRAGAQPLAALSDLVVTLARQLRRRGRLPRALRAAVCQAHEEEGPQAGAVRAAIDVCRLR